MEDQFNLENYIYDLPPEKIAKYPLENRDDSKLLVYKKGKIIHSLFKDILAYLPDESMLVFNNTKVIQARLVFHRNTGAKLEVFCLEPYFLNGEINDLLNQRQQSTWKCFVGNKDKWKHREALELRSTYKKQELILTANLVDDINDTSVIRFNWNLDISFYEILEHFGKIPIPPYLKRPSQPSDKDTYQTVYASVNGAVAAPTAGFHFTPEILDALEKKGIKKEFVTLHVGAGTFKPIKSVNILKHKMHSEQLIFHKEFIQSLCNHTGRLIPVGTTSLRALESLYWFGVKLLKEIQDKEFNITGMYPYKYESKELPARKEVLLAILNHFSEKNTDTIVGQTSIYIIPGYVFKMCDDLITNFHMPGSTLILLIAAFVGKDWKKIYKEALENDYRFLSYGDSSILST